MMSHSGLNLHGDHNQDVRLVLSKTLTLLICFKAEDQICKIHAFLIKNMDSTNASGRIHKKTICHALKALFFFSSERVVCKAVLYIFLQ